jgi:iron complex transport system ATP-binding protein
MTVCLMARGLTFGYGGSGWGSPSAPVLFNGLNIDIEQGQFVGLLGPNGAGKTTLLRLLAGILPPRSGTVSLFGRPVGSLPPGERSRQMAFVPQGSRPAFDFNVLDLVLMGRSPHLGWLGIEGRRDIEIAREALAFTDASEFEPRAFGSLSAGERQRVLLARALAQQTPVVLLDEPTAFLDLGHQVQLYDLLVRLARERGTTLLVASHDLNMAGRTCDRVVVVRRGEVAADGDPHDVLTAGLIRSTYGVETEVRHDPDLGPVIVPLGRAAREGRGNTGRAGFDN